MNEQQKNINELKYVLVIFVIGFVVMAIALFNARAKAPEIVYIQDPNIPSAREIQQRLKDLDDPRYDPNGIDGWIGKDSRTAWDNYTCDQYAKRAIEGEPK